MIEEIEIQGRGFVPLKDYGSWRIAQLSYDAELNAPESLASLGRHLETEEAFLLVEGEAVMVIAGIRDIPQNFETVRFFPGKIYVVRQGQWHAAVLKPGARLLIVENRDTGAENSENHILSDSEKLEIRKGFARQGSP